MANTTKKQVPVEALRFAAEITQGDNGSGSKTVPIKLVARSAQPIEHWYWGRVAHDLSGMTSKSRVPLDYCHNEAEVIGYANKFTVDGDGLVASGALTPYADGDRASEVIHKSREGVPYEASIFFDPDNLVIEEIPRGMSATVNGYDLEGPAAVIRQWTLRGIAVCPYGADGSTSVQFSKSGRDVAVAVFSKEQKTMATNATETDTTDGNADKQAEAMTLEQWCEKMGLDPTKLDDAQKKMAEAAVAAANAATSETETETEVETETETETQPPEKPKADDSALSAGGVESGKTDGKRFLSAFGDQGGVWFAQGLTFEQSQAKFTEANLERIKKLEADNKELSGKLAKLRGESSPVSFSTADDADDADDKPAPTKQQEAAVGPGLAKFAAGIRMPTKKS
jgi:hypothetical protein